MMNVLASTMRKAKEITCKIICRRKARSVRAGGTQATSNN